MIEIKQDKNLCIGCGACVAVCPDNWIMGKDKKAKPIKTKINEIGCNAEAASICPVQCIKIIKK